MASTVLRLGLWTLILSLGLFVLETSFPTLPLAEIISFDLVQNILVLSVVLIAAGIALRMFTKTAGKVLQKSNRCRVCDTVIPAGQIYCRPHLRGMLEREDRRTHNTRIR